VVVVLVVILLMAVLVVQQALDLAALVAAVAAVLLTLVKVMAVVALAYLERALTELAVDLTCLEMAALVVLTEQDLMVVHTEVAAVLVMMTLLDLAVAVGKVQLGSFGAQADHILQLVPLMYN